MEKNNKTLNVPHLRFPEFSGAWETATLQSVATLSKGAGISKDQLSEEGQACILYGELYTKYNSEIIDTIISKTDIDSEKLVKSQANDVIIPCSGESAVDIATAKCIKLSNVLLGGDLNIIRLKGEHDGSFFAYQLNGKRKYDIAKVAQGVSVVHLYGEHLKGVKVNYPSATEQKKISSLLALIDQRIETQKKIIEKYESLIRGLYQFLFQQAKYDYFVSLGDISQISNGNSDVKDASMDNDGSLYPFFDRSDEIKFLPEYLFDKEAIIYPGEGAEFYPRYYNGKFALHQRCYAVYDISTDFIPRYLYHYCKTQNSYFVRNAVGSTVASLRLDTFKRLKIPAIPTHHQESLVMFLDKIEAKIECNRTILKKYEEQKKYLLFTLFI